MYIRTQALCAIVALTIGSVMTVAEGAPLFGLQVRSQSHDWMFPSWLFGPSSTNSAWDQSNSFNGFAIGTSSDNMSAAA